MKLCDPCGEIRRRNTKEEEKEQLGLSLSCWEPVQWTFKLTLNEGKSNQMDPKPKLKGQMFQDEPPPTRLTKNLLSLRNGEKP